MIMLRIGEREPTVTSDTRHVSSAQRIIANQQCVRVVTDPNVKIDPETLAEIEPPTIPQQAQASSPWQDSQ
jgi:hypothetical protein